MFGFGNPFSNRPRLQIPPFVPYLALALAVFATYRNVFFNQFVFDDEILIVSNRWLRGWGHVSEILTVAGRFFQAVANPALCRDFQSCQGDAILFPRAQRGASCRQYLPRL